MHSASRSVTMTRRPHRRQGRKSRLLAKMASLGGTHARGARPFRRSMTGSGDIGVCPGDGPRFLPVGVSLRAQGGRAPCRCRKGAGEGGLASPVPTTQRGDHGQDRSKSRRKACSSGCWRWQVWRWSPASPLKPRRIRRRPSCRRSASRTTPAIRAPWLSRRLQNRVARRSACRARKSAAGGRRRGARPATVRAAVRADPTGVAGRV